MTTQTNLAVEPTTAEIAGEDEALVSPIPASYPDWFKQVVESMLDSEQKWLELAAEQNALTLKALKQGVELFRKTPAPPFSEWATQQMETFMERQQKWVDRATRQRGQLVQRLQEAEKAAEGTPTPNAKTVTDFANQQLENLIEARNRWLDFLAKQNELFLQSMEEIFGVKDSSAANRAKLVEETVDNYIEMQKRWLAVATLTPAEPEAHEAAVAVVK
jgi:hypothetical protein